MINSKNQQLPHAEIIVDDQLTLRQVRLDEAEKLFSVIDKDREYLGQWLPWPSATLSPDDSKAFITDTIQQRIKGSTYGFGIVLDGEIVGHIGLMHLDEGKPEIGYWIASAAAGKGLATKAAGAVTDFGFNTLGLKKIVIKADTKNIGSNRVAEKLGYKLEKTEYDNNIKALANIWAMERK